MENLLNIHYIDTKNKQSNKLNKEIINIPCKKTIKKAIEKKSKEDICLIILFIISIILFSIAFIKSYKKYKLINYKNVSIHNSINSLNNFNDSNL